LDYWYSWERVEEDFEINAPFLGCLEGAASACLPNRP
jgi:hypothetical protein